MAEFLKFRLADGTVAVAEVEAGEARLPVGEFLTARPVVLDTGTSRLRQHRAVSGRNRERGYERLDNEILVGRRLAEAAGRSPYPAELVRLYGDNADGADPYALFEEYQGTPMREACKVIIGGELEAFLVSLLRGLCWLTAIGIAHRRIGPDTVLWDGRRALITDFSRCMVFGVSRTPVRGFPAWVPEEQRLGTTTGRVGPRDDIWAAAQLIFYAHTQGQEFLPPEQLAASGLSSQLVRALGWAFGPAADRPTAGELLAYFGRSDPSPRGFTGGPLLAERRESFLAARALKHGTESAPVPDDFNQDMDLILEASALAQPSAVPAAVESLVAAPPVLVDQSDGQPPDPGNGVAGTLSGDSKKRPGFFGRRRDDR